MLKPKATVKAAKLVSCVALSAALACTVPVAAFATPGEDAQAQADAALSQLNELNEKLEVAEARYGNAVMEQEAAQARVTEAQNKIDEATARIGDLQGKLGNRARSMYRSGSAGILDLLLGATSFEEFATNWNLLERLNQSDSDMVNETKTLKTQVEEEKVVLEEQEAAAAEAAAEAEAIVNEASAAQAQMQATYDSLSEEAARILAEEQAARERAEEEANRRAAEEAQRQDQGNNGGGGDEKKKGNAPDYDVNTGNTTVDRAYAELGKPYVWGATGPSSYDCSGLVGYALTGSHGRIGTTYTFMGWPRVSPSEAQPGDVVTNDHHCGVYIGGGMMIHAPHTGDVVKVSAVHAGMIYVRYPY